MGNSTQIERVSPKENPTSSGRVITGKPFVFQFIFILYLGYRIFLTF